MTKKDEELKPKGDEPTDPNAPEGKEGQPSGDEPKTDEDGLKKQDGDIDYAAELEKAKRDRDNYKQGLLNTKDELKKAKEISANNPGLNKEEVIEEVSKQLSEQFKSELDEREKRLEARISEERTQKALDNASSSPEERELIEWHLRNSIVSSGNVDEDIENARLLANKKRIFSENDELKRVLHSKQTQGGAEFSGNKIRPEKDPTTGLTAKEKAFLQSTGALERYKKNAGKAANVGAPPPEDL